MKPRTGLDVAIKIKILLLQVIEPRPPLLRLLRKMNLHQLREKNTYQIFRMVAYLNSFLFKGRFSITMLLISLRARDLLRTGSFLFTSFAYIYRTRFFST
jgi:hypothetical protein